MARFLRRQVTYVLRPPVSFPVAPSTFVADPVHSHLAPPVRTRVRSRLNAPAVVFSAYTPFGPKTARAPQPRQGRQPHYLLRPPATLVQPFTARKPSSTFATQAQQGRRASYVLRPPATLVQPAAPFIARPAQTKFAVATRRATEQHFFTSVLFPPEVIDPLPQTGPSSRKLARTPRQARVTQSTLRPPTILGAVTVTPPFRPLQVNFATAVKRATQRRSNTSRLAKPTVVGTATVFRPVAAAYKTATNRAAQSGRYRPGNTLSAPAVVTPAASGGDNPVGGVFDPNFFLLIHP